MRRPVTVLVPILALLLALGIPFLGEKQGLPGRERTAGKLRGPAGLGHDPDRLPGWRD